MAPAVGGSEGVIVSGPPLQPIGDRHRRGDGSVSRM
jgi:hypothetical protein